MRYLLDTSALIPLVIDFGEEVLQVAKKTELYLLDLTLYGAGNALWKMTTLLRTISLEDALELNSIVQKMVTKKFLKVVTYRELNLKETLEVAALNNLTFYDAAYVTAAEHLNATLVTEDEPLREKAGKYIETATYADFKQKASQPETT
ncbi:MAG: type II toxin-antitoxin system VapC family toxin [Desulfurococcales archaeon]|nr:type II toxin-antitoxin system VapC family toxin [Desulfurococcales archaeon]